MTMPKDNFPASITFRRVRGKAKKTQAYMCVTSGGWFNVRYRKGWIFMNQDYGCTYYERVPKKRRRNGKA